MNIIKLNAIDSTNDYLKNLLDKKPVINYTVVTANFQNKGKGQMGGFWESEAGKNLICSVYLSNSIIKLSNQFVINIIVCLAIKKSLHKFNIPQLSVKWPNDIMSGNKKICGVLIENNLKGAQITSAVIGIGLNVNQTVFPVSLDRVSSLQLLCGKGFELNYLLKKIILSLKRNIALLEAKEFKSLEVAYLDVLFKKNIPTMFKDSRDALFMGMVLGVSKDGKLQIALEDETVLEFGIKEISFL